MNIYVGNLDYSVDENDLQGIFEEYGTVSEVRVIKDKFNGRSKGFGFVTMNDSNEGKKAIEELNGATLEDRQITVNEAREKSESDSKPNFKSNNRFSNRSENRSDSRSGNGQNNRRRY